MNLLAHAYLSGDDDYLLIGNFIADHIKGNKTAHFPEGVINGIILHRNIDHFTDQHPVFNRSCNRLYPRYHKYSGVVVDILYDHFLARHWRNYHHLPLKEFTENCYGILLKHYQILPQRTKSLLPNIMMDNWLLSYYSFKGLAWTFQGMARRVKYNPGLEHAVDDLQLHYDDFEKDFMEFFDDLIVYSRKKRMEILGLNPSHEKRMIRREKARRFLSRLLQRSGSGFPPSEMK